MKVVIAQVFFVTVLSEESTLIRFMGFYSGQMIHVRLDTYVFEIFSKCKVLVSATVVLFVRSIIVCVSFLSRIYPSSLLSRKARGEQKKRAVTKQINEHCFGV